MSLYNLINGYNSSCIFILPLLGKKVEDYPRFRDCYLGENADTICIYTRVGGGNRNCGFGEEQLYSDENFLKTYDDDFDSTYATYEFKVPEKWKSDFEKLVKGNIKETSQEYQELIKSFYPKLASQLETLFKKEN